MKENTIILILLLLTSSAYTQRMAVDQQDEPAKLFLKQGSKKQLLNEPALDFPTAIAFAGDLDGDNKDDYIIHYGDKAGVMILYLTSQAKTGELIRRVAVFYASWCC